MNFQTLFDRVMLFGQMMLPDRSLKYFPPNFTVRRPVVSLLDKRVKQGAECYLTLFRLEFSELQQEVPEEVWNGLQECSRRHLRLSVTNTLGEHRVIAIDQFDKMDFVLLLEGHYRQGDENGLIPVEHKMNIDRIRSELEIGLAGNRPDWRNSLRVVTASVPISSKNPLLRTERLLFESYQTAVALATGVITPQMKDLRSQMEQLLDQGSISVLAQPIMNLTSGDVYGWEILTRGPVGSVLHLPDELFQFASQTRLLSRLEFLVVKRALEEIASRKIKEPVFLNVTAVTLSHPLFLSHVLQCLERHSMLSPQQVYFEITERHQITNMEAMIEILRTYRTHGFRFAVDDAGSGYSSLQWIGELVPELIKIDRSVIRHVNRIAIKESLLRAIVTAAREMKCEIVAEGVESEEEADVLFKLDVDMGQGFYFARPNVLLHENERDMFQETKVRIQHRRGLVAS
ncbi:EAL domain-containing protein [Cohnella cholangitidis]|uniref:EAL domain-containing protein n=1 Tax=Cohnella cholangitidis TaxID=2598458 RepID=A0A7G5C2Q9_9BACL|nr:EAL domain-containing protein [Cohnella cholangitidis]QMV43493.1 EAL domain-containing protein [Cohnella cholangitidis]